MLLFGIPHKGLVVDNIREMLDEYDNHSRHALLEQIKTESDLLPSQLAYFKNLIRDRRVVSYYEQSQTQELKPQERPAKDEQQGSETRRWERTGDFFTAVEPDSALLQLPDSIEEKIPVNADHSMMVKFDSTGHQGYRSARAKLQQFEQDAPGVVEGRFRT